MVTKDPGLAGFGNGIASISSKEFEGDVNSPVPSIHRDASNGRPEVLWSH